MTILPETSARLLSARHNPLPMEIAAALNFNAVGVDEHGKPTRGALYASDETTQQFWNEFSRAAAALRNKKEPA